MAPDLLNFNTLLVNFAKCSSYLSNVGLGPELNLSQLQFQVKPCLLNVDIMLVIFVKG